MEESFIQSIKILIDKLNTEKNVHNKNNYEEEVKRADRLASFVEILKSVLKENDRNILFDYVNDLKSRIQQYITNQGKSYEYEYADYQYILISILNLFPNQNTTTITNTFIKDLSDKVIEKINTFNEQEG